MCVAPGYSSLYEVVAYGCMIYAKRLSDHGQRFTALVALDDVIDGGHVESNLS